MTAATVERHICCDLGDIQHFPPNLTVLEAGNNQADPYKDIQLERAVAQLLGAEDYSTTFFENNTVPNNIFSFVDSHITTPELRELALQIEKEKNSIFNSFTIENEISFLNKIEYVSQEEKLFNIQEDMVRFLGEYAGNVPFTKISYIQREGELYLYGQKSNDIYQKTALLAGTGSREYFDGIGFQKIETGLGQEGYTMASQNSPALKDSTYGFNFTYLLGQFDPRLNGRVVSEFILRYPEKWGDLSQSHSIIESIKPGSTHSYSHPEDFVANPTLLKTDNPAHHLIKLMDATGITGSDIQKSLLFEKLVRTRLKSQINDFVFGVEQVNNIANPEEYERGVAILQLLVATIYQEACVIKDEIDYLTGDGAETAVPTPISSHPHYTYKLDLELLAHQAQNGGFYVAAGGNCPSTRANVGYGYDVVSKLERGVPLEKMAIKTGDMCSCGRPNDGHFHCNACGQTFEDESGSTSRTNKCTKCGDTKSFMCGK
ncbi:hypothetical protein HGB07_03880 [Candidatus Roizmanbacteria bacterium]|nr:hypothetical protein [Candidatus Roizmanbacteria bacterium]